MSRLPVPALLLLRPEFLHPEDRRGCALPYRLAIGISRRGVGRLLSELPTSRIFCPLAPGADSQQSTGLRASSARTHCRVEEWAGLFRNSPVRSPDRPES